MRPEEVSPAALTFTIQRCRPPDIDLISVIAGTTIRAGFRRQPVRPPHNAPLTGACPIVEYEVSLPLRQAQATFRLHVSDGERERTDVGHKQHELGRKALDLVLEVLERTRKQRQTHDV